MELLHELVRLWDAQAVDEVGILHSAEHVLAVREAAGADVAHTTRPESFVLVDSKLGARSRPPSSRGAGSAWI